MGSLQSKPQVQPRSRQPATTMLAVVVATGLLGAAVSGFTQLVIVDEQWGRALRAGGDPPSPFSAGSVAATTGACVIGCLLAGGLGDRHGHGRVFAAGLGVVAFTDLGAAAADLLGESGAVWGGLVVRPFGLFGVCLAAVSGSALVLRAAPPGRPLGGAASGVLVGSVVGLGQVIDEFLLGEVSPRLVVVVVGSVSMIVAGWAWRLGPSGAASELELRPLTGWIVALVPGAMGLTVARAGGVWTLLRWPLLGASLLGGVLLAVEWRRRPPPGLGDRLATVGALGAVAAMGSVIFSASIGRWTDPARGSAMLGLATASGRAIAGGAMAVVAQRHRAPSLLTMGRTSLGSLAVAMVVAVLGARADHPSVVLAAATAAGAGVGLTSVAVLALLVHRSDRYLGRSIGEGTGTGLAAGLLVTLHWRVGASLSPPDDGWVTVAVVAVAVVVVVGAALVRLGRAPRPEPGGGGQAPMNALR